MKLEKIERLLKMSIISVSEDGKISIDRESLGDLLKTYGESVIEKSPLVEELKEKELEIEKLHNDIVGLKDDTNKGIDVKESPEYKNLELRLSLAKEGLLNAELLGDLDELDVLDLYEKRMSKEGATHDAVLEKLKSLLNLGEKNSPEPGNDEDESLDDDEDGSLSNSGENMLDEDKIDGVKSPELKGKLSNNEVDFDSMTFEEAYAYDLAKL